MEEEFDIFGFKVKVNKTAHIVTMTEFSETEVQVTIINQKGQISTFPINTNKDFDKSPQEFIKEFNNQLHK
ncbi:MAG TPA: hypothetical protein PK289_01260 [Bacteroidia bacterium]|nr:hypothetical protein [Bacteroidia bacterium]